MSQLREEETEVRGAKMATAPIQEGQTERDDGPRTHSQWEGQGRKDV